MFWILLLMISSQTIQAQHSISVDIKKRVEAGKSANVAVLSNYAPNNPLSAGSLIEYEISIEEEEESYRFYHIQIKRVLFREYGKDEMYGFDSYYPQIDNHIFEAQEALVGTGFRIGLNESLLPQHTISEGLHEQAVGQVNANPQQRAAMLGVYNDYFNEELFRQHINTLFGTPQEVPPRADISTKMLPEAPESRRSVLTGHIDNSEIPSVELISVGLYVHGLEGEKSEFKLGENNTFQFSFDLSRPSRIHLFIEGIPNPLIIYMQPGDRLQANIKPEIIHDKQHNFSWYEMNHRVGFIGDRVKENTFLKEYFVKYRSHIAWKLPVEGFNSKALFSRKYIPSTETVKQLQSGYRSSLAFLQDKADELDPVFVGFWETEIRYFYHLQIKGNSHETGHLYDSLTLSFPILDKLFSQDISYDYTENSFWYQAYMEDYFQTKTIYTSALGTQDHISLESRYHFIGMVFKGYPMYFKQAEMLLACYEDRSINLHMLEAFAEDFLENCQDERMKTPVRQAMEKANNLKRGGPIPTFVLSDEKGEALEINRWSRKPILLVFSTSFSESEETLFHSLHDEFPELEILLVERHHQITKSDFRIREYRSGRSPSSVFKAFEAKSSSLPGAKFPPQTIGQDDLEALGLDGSNRYYAFLTDRSGILQSEWGEHILDYPENLRENINWIIHGDAHDNPWLSAEVLWPVGSGLVALPILFILLMRLYRRRTDKREAARRLALERELKGIRAQLNPHFLFNAMGSIQNLVDSAKPEEANHYLSQFSSLMRQVLSHSQQEMIPLADEINLLNNYLELETLRHGFLWEISVDPNIDIHNTEVPSMMLQPYVENAILHGIAGMGAEGNILIKIDKLNQQLLVTIEDNGLGIENSLELQGDQRTQGSGLGMKLTQERMEKLGDRYGGDFRILLHDRMYDELATTGTRVEVWIPMES